MGMVQCSGTAGHQCHPGSWRGNRRECSLELENELCGAGCLTGEMQVRSWRNKCQTSPSLLLVVPIGQTQPEPGQPLEQRAGWRRVRVDQEGRMEVQPNFEFYIWKHLDHLSSINFRQNLACSAVTQILKAVKQLKWIYTCQEPRKCQVNEHQSCEKLNLR